MPEGIYQQIAGIKGKALFTSRAGGRQSEEISWMPGGEPPAKATMEMYDFATGKAEPVVSDITDFVVSADRKTLVYRAGNRLRVFKAGEKSDDAAAKEPAGRKSGWIDLKRLRISVEPTDEWRQMYGEAWRLQTEQFWVEDMADVDWQGVYDRYLPLLDRISTRNEFPTCSGKCRANWAAATHTQPAEISGPNPNMMWASSARNSSGMPERTAGRSAPSARRHVGRRIRSATASTRRGRARRRYDPCNQRKTPDARPFAGAVAGQPGGAGSGDHHRRRKRHFAAGGHSPHHSNEQPMQYRDWVETNRAWVHEQSGGRCGYVHVPNMGPIGYAEFHRGFLAELHREGLVVDVRFNGGGHVSALLLEKLARRRIAWCQTRWFGTQPWPDDSPAGPMVALTNEFAGSDGDIFSQNFKAMKLGPLHRQAHWGGVIGIWPRHTLVDGGMTTQPEFSFWFRDVGWKVENYGVDPDIEVEYPAAGSRRGKRSATSARRG